VADEPASPQRDVSQGEACPTDSGFKADQDRATIAKSSTLPYDSAPHVTSLAEGSVPTVSEEVPSASLVFATATVEYHQFSLELPIERRVELISDLVKYQDNYNKIYKFQSQKRKPWTKKQKRDYYMAVIRSNLGRKVKDFKGITFEKVEAKF
nr:hypothetical protein [Tanacetum cinerariifolium]